MTNNPNQWIPRRRSTRVSLPLLSLMALSLLSPSSSTNNPPSDNFVLYINGAPTLIGGTSAAAPLFAAILNRINEERLAVGKKTVGFVNPTLYANPGIFHDITNGSNPGCGTNGFSCVKGWDPGKSFR